METIFISKLEAARRQLSVAASLYFNEDDPFSIHTLTAAAYEILKDLASQTGDKLIIDRGLEKYFEEPDQHKIRKALRTPQNFLKHADRDPDCQLEFSPKLTKVMLFDGILSYCQMTDERLDQLDPLSIFLEWTLIHHPDWAAHIPKAQQFFEQLHEQLHELGNMSRKEFFQERILAVERWRARVTPTGARPDDKHSS